MKGNYRKSSRAAKQTDRNRAKRTHKQVVRKPRASEIKQEERRPGRQQEILGVLVMALALLWSLSVVTYNPSDSGQIAGKSFWQLFVPEVGSSITNSLGPVGAYLAQAAVPHFFGLMSLIPGIAVVALGYLIMRRKRLKPLLFPSAVSLLLMVFLATVLARLALDVEALDSHFLTGGAGTAAGLWMQNILGSIGSYAMLVLILIIGLMLLIDRDFQRTFDRMENGFRRLRASFAAPPEAADESKDGSTTWAELHGETTPAEPGEEDPLPTDSAKTPAAAVNMSRASSTTATAQPAAASKTMPTIASKAMPAAIPKAKPVAQATETASAVQPPDIELKVYGPVEEEKATMVSRNATAASDAPPYSFPPINLLDGPADGGHQIDFDELEENKRKLLDKLAVYNIEITDINAVVGPTVTLYELAPAPGVKISKIKSLEDDLAMAMAARGIRMIAPIPGKSVVGVEIPNRNRELVRVEQIIGTTKFAEAKMELPIALGKTIEGEVYLQDLTKMPHLLIAGATGSGKSVGLNALIAGLLYACHPTNLKFVMVDPKKIELQQYRDLRDHFLAMPEDGEEAIITEVLDALSILKSCELEMEARYNLLSDARVRGVRDYNKAFRAGSLAEDKGHKYLPYIIVIIDELADLMMTAGKDIEAPIARLAQMARAVGIHLVLATQRPSVDVITGLIKANFPSRVAFQVASKIDARTILDQNGAEQLVGNGDMLYMSGSRLLRLQGPFVSVKEIDRLMDYIRSQNGPGPYRLPAVDETPDMPARTGEGSNADSGDALFQEAARIIVRAQQGSVSLLQRKLSIGYTRAARIVDELERMGVVGPYQGAKARDVLVPDEQVLDHMLQSDR